eukprot:TRINITY_DN4034_c0_g1_i3.p1 TRINITY_DN4034_c0_g1~~TRINITY_DN4034_c0_g1_i3.p1  ORF type:complete len:336 (-),score=43.46 TRINITY_DN4034_c0_g1_i3:137-1144(-)
MKSSDSMDEGVSNNETKHVGKRPLPLNCQSNRKQKRMALSVCDVEQSRVSREERDYNAIRETIVQFNRCLDSNYAEDIHRTQCENEEKAWRENAWRVGLEAIQSDVNHTMRGILVDWLGEVAEEYQLQSQTLFLAVTYVDQVLNTVDFNRKKLQLLGITCMLIASKYEEISAPPVDDFVYITDYTYGRNEILSMELNILCWLKYKLTVTTIHNFLSRFLLVSGVSDDRVYFHASYIAEMILPFYNILRKYRPSLLAAAIVCVSKHAFGLPVWSPLFEAYTTFRPVDVRACIHEITVTYHMMFSAPTGKLTAAREKYKNPKYRSVSTIPLPTSFAL